MVSGVLDTVVIAIIVIGALLGFLTSKFSRKILGTIGLVIALAISYFLSSSLTLKIRDTKVKFLGNATVFEWIREKIQSVETIKNVYDKVPLMDELILCLIKIIVFFGVGIACFIVAKIVFGIIGKIVFRERHGIVGRVISMVVGAINGAIISFFILFPLASTYPLTSNMTKLSDTIDSESFKKTAEKIEGFTTGSSILKTYNKIIDKNHVSFLEYENSKDETDTKKYYFVSELDGTVNLAIFSLKMNQSNEGQGLLTLTEDELNEMFAAISESGTAKEILQGVVEEFGLDVDIENIDLSNEGKTVAYVLNIAQTESYEDVDVEELVENIYNSPLIIAIAETNEGILKDVDNETQSLIKGKLGDKVAKGEMSQDDMDSLMWLFTPKENAD